MEEENDAETKKAEAQAKEKFDNWMLSCPADESRIAFILRTFPRLCPFIKNWHLPRDANLVHKQSLKKYYLEARALLHPLSQGKNASVHQVKLAEHVFIALPKLLTEGDD